MIAGVVAVIPFEAEEDRQRREYIARRRRWQEEADALDAWKKMRGRADEDNAFRDSVLLGETAKAIVDANIATRAYTSLVRTVQATIAARYEISFEDLISCRRTARPTLIRQIACWACKQLTTRSLPEIGRAFGGRDHTTILHAVTKIDRLREESVKFLSRTDGDLAAARAAVEAHKIRIATMAARSLALR